MPILVGVKRTASFLEDWYSYSSQPPILKLRYNNIDFSILVNSKILLSNSLPNPIQYSHFKYMFLDKLFLMPCFYYKLYIIKF